MSPLDMNQCSWYTDSQTDGVLWQSLRWQTGWMDDIILKAIAETDTDTVTSPQTVTAGRWVRGRHGKYKTRDSFPCASHWYTNHDTFLTDALSHHPAWESPFVLNSLFVKHVKKFVFCCFVEFKGRYLHFKQECCLKMSIKTIHTQNKWR